MPQEDEQFDSLPPAIVDALRDLDGPAVMPDPRRDADVLSGARQHLAETAGLSRKRRNLRLFFAGGAGGAIAAAAMIALIVFIASPVNGPQSEQDFAANTPDSPQSAAARPGDLNDDGTIDILDAYVLAKQIERDPSSLAMDLNRDGEANQRDIDWVAQQAVALNTGERG